MQNISMTFCTNQYSGQVWMFWHYICVFYDTQSYKGEKTELSSLFNLPEILQHQKHVLNKF